MHLLSCSRSRSRNSCRCHGIQDNTQGTDCPCHELLPLRLPDLGQPVYAMQVKHSRTPPPKNTYNTALR